MSVTRRSDPERRSRIVDAALRVIAADGVAGTSHRKVAAAADVPLGSMTYHFTGMDELLREAFMRFSDRVADQFAERMEPVRTRDEAIEAVVASITDDVLADAEDHVLTHELYTLAARDPAFREITERWMARTRSVLDRYFDPVTSRLLDALIEGLSIHRALDRQPSDAATVAEAVRRVTAV